jgi:hypothetical protein
VSREAMLTRRRARGRANALASRLHGDICRLLAQEAAHGRLPPSIRLPAVAATAAPADLVQQVQTNVSRIDEALRFGLDFDDALDPELRYRRAHVCNIAFMIRRNIESALLPHGHSVLHADHLVQAGRHALELIETVSWIERRVVAIEAEALDDSWSATWPATLLAIASRLLPVHHRREFIEDQCANLALASSRREWARYMVDLLCQMPRIAVAAHSSGDAAAQCQTDDPEAAVGTPPRPRTRSG